MSAHRCNLQRDPNKALWAAVLEQAVADATDYACGISKPRFKRGSSLNTTSLRHKALTWMDSPVVWVGSYLWICELLDLNAESIRAQVNDYNQRSC